MMHDEYNVGTSIQRIPKNIHIIWPHESWCNAFSICLEKITKLHQDWEIKVWRLNNLPNLCCQDIIEDAIKRDTIAFASTFIGIQILVRYGGIVLDPDTYLFRNIDPLTYSTSRCLVMRNFRFYGTHMIGCEPHDPYFTRAIRAMPDFYGSICSNHIPNDIFTASKLFHFIEDCSSHMKTNLRPTAHHNLCIPEESILIDNLKKYIHEKGILPSYVRGIRVTPDRYKYHNLFYGKGTETYIKSAENRIEGILKDYKNVTTLE